MADKITYVCVGTYETKDVDEIAKMTGADKDDVVALAVAKGSRMYKDSLADEDEVAALAVDSGSRMCKDSFVEDEPVAVHPPQGLLPDLHVLGKKAARDKG